MTIRDFLRIYVLWAPDSAESKRIAELLVSHFDGLGMERDGVAIRVPVRFRSKAWIEADQIPRDIDLEGAEHNAIVLLYDPLMAEEKDAWDGYVAVLRKKISLRKNVDVYVPFGSPERDAALASDGAAHTQYARRDKWKEVLKSGADRDNRLLLHLLLTIRQHLKGIYAPLSPDEPLFVSHAKADGDETARAIVDYVNDSQNDVPLQTFYDAMELLPGEDYERRFETEIGKGTLLAISSDVYDSRPWCVFELTTAKRAYRPIVLADVATVKTSRTYPYGANLPKVRVAIGDNNAWIEKLLVEALSEGLRCDLFTAQAKKRAEQAGLSAIITPRPPELFDLTVGDGLASTLIYPDPPLGKIESEILETALASSGRKLDLKTLSEVR
ncbi:TIR domain-containing protein [Rhizobium ruizarguesonis]|uniref:toll/interleukin-1 receptor domain-containing protein n=1 Tax=Rhizobium ruizarguesonis TaxID=2081791 RepID=UPI00102FA71A|nr:toll/interleukin-1 receptor domain-containing protein [Rhizobium ruizarguesonis]TBE02279.1 hypothetical protein ELH10_15375 [Rhizobium ruizarguesonis]TBF14655.1 hypothetical protein ELG95_14520 [Rhizobium ruizarguesonis]